MQSCRIDTSRTFFTASSHAFFRSAALTLFTFIGSRPAAVREALADMMSTREYADGSGVAVAFGGMGDVDVEEPDALAIPPFATFFFAMMMRAEK